MLLSPLIMSSNEKVFVQGHRWRGRLYVGSERGIVSQTATAEPQITEGRVAHTGSAFLPLTVTAPTDVCLNWALICGEITSLLKSPPTPPSPPMLSMLFSATRGQTGTQSPQRFFTSYQTPPCSPLAMTHWSDPCHL